MTVACAVLFSPAIVGAQGSLQFVSPDDMTKVALHTNQTVTVSWTIGERPVIGETVNVATDLGTLSDMTPTTDFRGIATFKISSTEEGMAAITASGGDLSASLQLEFADSALSNDPFADVAVLENADTNMPLWVFKDRIAFLGRDGAGIEDVGGIAADENLTQLSPLGDRIFVLSTRETVPRIRLRELARGT